MTVVGKRMPNFQVLTVNKPTELVRSGQQRVSLTFGDSLKTNESPRPKQKVPVVEATKPITPIPVSIEDAGL